MPKKTDFEEYVGSRLTSNTVSKDIYDMVQEKKSEGMQQSDIVRQALRTQLEKEQGLYNIKKEKLIESFVEKLPEILGSMGFSLQENNNNKPVQDIKPKNEINNDEVPNDNSIPDSDQDDDKKDGLTEERKNLVKNALNSMNI